jgi:glycosyltransferase involved in cell wall biosynthesis
MLISVVIPAYKSSETIPILVEKLESVLNKITLDYEIIFIDDCCPDNSWHKINNICKSRGNIKGIKLTKNFGQHSAISAGLHHAKGEWIIIMDCDLQDDPIYIENLYKKTKIVEPKIIFARRKSRKDNFLTKYFSHLFYRVLGYLTEIDFDETVANYGIFHKDIIKVYNDLKEVNTVFPIVIKSMGFEIDYIDVNHNLRYFGKSSYNIRKRLKLAFDIILSHSNKPLILILKFGFFVSTTSFLFAIFTLFRYFNGSIKVSGYTSILFSIWFLSGLIIFIFGFIGLYIGKIFDNVKNRPDFLIDKKINL